MSYLAKAREPISSLSHCIGAVVFAAATLLLVGKTLFDDWSPKILVGVIVFGASLVALYSASAIYHFPMARRSGSCGCVSWTIR